MFFLRHLHAAVAAEPHIAHISFSVWAEKAVFHTGSTAPNFTPSIRGLAGVPNWPTTGCAKQHIGHPRLLSGVFSALFVRLARVPEKLFLKFRSPSFAGTCCRPHLIFRLLLNFPSFFNAPMRRNKKGILSAQIYNIKIKNLGGPTNYNNTFSSTKTTIVLCFPIFFIYKIILSFSNRLFYKIYFHLCSFYTKSLGLGPRRIHPNIHSTITITSIHAVVHREYFVTV